jgi:hypothetical protein
MSEKNEKASVTLRNVPPDLRTLILSDPTGREVSIKVKSLTKRQTRILFKIFDGILQRLKEPNMLGLTRELLYRAMEDVVFVVTPHGIHYCPTDIGNDEIAIVCNDRMSASVSAMVLLLHALAHFLDEKDLLPQKISTETDNIEAHDRNELQHELWCAEMLEYEPTSDHWAREKFPEVFNQTKH